MANCGLCSKKLTIFNTGLGGKLENGEKLCIACYNKMSKKNSSQQTNEINKIEYLFELKGWNGQLYVTENYIAIERKGAISFITQGGIKGRKEIPISSITAIQIKKAGALAGYIQFSVIGGIEDKGGLFDAAMDENSISFYEENNHLANEIKNFLQDKISKNGEKHVVNNISSADEILKFKQLLDTGIISAEEFEAKKKQLLGL